MMLKYAKGLAERQRGTHTLMFGEQRLAMGLRAIHTHRYISFINPDNAY
jgi:hypothetical protein